MKYLSFAVPSFNSENYMRKCIDSLLTGGEDVEIIIVNDGSLDQTGRIADEYALKHPSIVKVIHKSNGGHGSGVNAGIIEATGLFFKVVDSDDWVDTYALKALLDTIKAHEKQKAHIDLYLTNFVYERITDNTSYVRSYQKKFNKNAITHWKDVKKFSGSEVILMHAMIHRTAILKENFKPLPEHTFYVDNIFAYQYLPFVKNIYYLDVDFYRYLIGRADQSINMENITRRYDQQIRVMKQMVDRFSYNDIKHMDRGLRRYMRFCLSAVMIVTMMFTTAFNTKERKLALKGLWNHIKKSDPKMYRKLYYLAYPASVNWLPFGMRGKVMTKGYKYFQRKVKLG